MSINKGAIEDERSAAQTHAIDVSGKHDIEDESREQSYAVDANSDSGDDDTVILPKGSLDPVYEAKARVLNRAVSLPQSAYHRAFHLSRNDKKIHTRQ